MSKRGRKPLPTKLHILRGEPGKRKHRLNAEPQPSPPGTLEPPEFLRPGAKRIWFILAPEFSAQGILTASDVPALAAFCSAYYDLENADLHLEAEGDMEMWTTKSGRIKKENPWHYVKSRALMQCDKFASQFGIGASYRAKLSISPAGKKGKNELWKEKYGK